MGWFRMVSWPKSPKLTEIPWNTKHNSWSTFWSALLHYILLRKSLVVRLRLVGQPDSCSWLWAHGGMEMRPQVSLNHLLVLQSIVIFSWFRCNIISRRKKVSSKLSILWIKGLSIASVWRFQQVCDTNTFHTFWWFLESETDRTLNNQYSPRKDARPRKEQAICMKEKIYFFDSQYEWVTKIQD